MSLKINLLSLSLLLGSSLARDVPSNIQKLYKDIKSQGQCNNKLASGFYSTEEGDNNFSYCGDRLKTSNIIYIQGTGGQFTNMDIDCDGTQGSAADDGRCGNSGDTQSITSFADTVAGYNQGIKDLDANIHPYVVFGNSGSKNGYKTFDPTKYGIKPLSVMAVVCGDQLVYGIWGDENGADGDKAVVGEASISLATKCYGTSMNGNNGHDENDVLYIAFVGQNAVPGAGGAKWAAKNFNEFESSIEKLGDKLIGGIST